MFRPLPTLTMPPCAVHVRLLMAVLSGLLITCGAALFATACSAPGYAYIRSPAVGVARATAVPALQRTVPALRRLVAREFLGPAVHLPRPAPLPHDSLSSALPKAKALALVGFALAVFAAVATGLRWGLCSAEGAGLGQTLALCAASGRKKKKSKPKKLGRTRRRPKAVVFDLDACIWMPDTWDCSGAPFRKTGPTSCQCSGGEMMRLLPSARNTIHMLKTDPEWSGTRIAVASCCCWPHWAEELFDLFELSPDMKLKEAWDAVVIQGSDKQAHFKKLSKMLMVGFEDMVFFDDSSWNCQSVAKLGVTCVHTPYGFSNESWREGLKKYGKGRR